MTKEKIGEAAGAVWKHLRSRSPAQCTVSELKKSLVGYKADEVVAGIGWLSREGKTVARVQGRKTLLGLVDSEWTFEYDAANSHAADSHAADSHAADSHAGATSDGFVASSLS